MVSVVLCSDYSHELPLSGSHRNEQDSCGAKQRDQTDEHVVKCFSPSLLNSCSVMTQWVPATGCRHQLEAARCGFIMMENKDSKIAAVHIDSIFNKNKDFWYLAPLCLSACVVTLKWFVSICSFIIFFSVCFQSGWCAADPSGPNMKLGLSLAVAAFVAVLLSSVDAQGKWHHVRFHSLSHCLSSSPPSSSLYLSLRNEMPHCLLLMRVIAYTVNSLYWKS